jgi:uncharacterized iron-regulated membrane protein
MSYRRSRVIILRFHRYVGLALAGILILMGASGALLAFYDDIDRFLNAGMHVAPPEPEAEPLLPLVLRKRLEEQISGVHVYNVPLSLQSGRAAVFPVTSKDGTPLENDEYFVNPYTGAILGQRKRGDLSQGLTNLMPFILDLHKSLMLGKIGKTILGFAALLWVFDCLFGLYLTLPPRREAPGRTSEQWLAHWAGAWLVRGGSFVRTAFTTHRAIGLWIWIMLLVFAVSATHLRLPSVYNPLVARTLGGMEDIYAQLTPVHIPEEEWLSWDRALAAAEAHMAELAVQRGFRIEEPQAFAYQEFNGLFYYRVRSTLDFAQGNTAIWIHPRTGELMHFAPPGGETAGDTLTAWLVALHFGSIWGPPHQAFVGLCGLLVIVLSVTGVILWWRKVKHV